jgi:hypothetical protein
VDVPGAPIGPRRPSIRTPLVPSLARSAICHAELLGRSLRASIDDEMGARALARHFPIKAAMGLGDASDGVLGRRRRCVGGYGGMEGRWGSVSLFRKERKGKRESLRPISG